jgi:hypothetical protein
MVCWMFVFQVSADTVLKMLKLSIRTKGYLKHFKEWLPVGSMQESWAKIIISC